MKTNGIPSGFKRTVMKGAAKIALIIVIAQAGALACAADFWTAKFLTSDVKKNRLESAPAFDAAGNTLAVWERYDTDVLPVVYVARSDDGGLSWTLGNIRDADAPAGVSDRSPVVVTDKAGKWLCVWSSDDPLSGAAGTDYDVLLSRSVDAGASWSTPQLLNSTGLTDTGDDVNPWVSMDEAGNCVAAWTSDNDLSNVSATTTSQTGVWVSRSSDAGGSWTPAEPLARGLGRSLSEPRLASNGNGSFGFVWTDRISGRTVGTVKFAYSGNAGLTWALPRLLNAGMGSSIPEDQKFNPAVAGDSSGRWMVAWNSPMADQFTTQTRAYIARTENNGADWLPVTNAASQSQPDDCFAPSLHTDGSGLWFVGSHKRDGFANLFFSRDFGGSWNTAPYFPSARVIYPTGIPEPPETTPYVWRKSETEWNALFGKANIRTDPINPNGQFEIRHATTIPPSSSPVNEDWAPAKSFVDGSVVYGTSPKLATDSGNTWVTVFSMGAPDGSADTEIGFSRSANGGRDWSAPQVLNSDWQSESMGDGAPVVAASEGQTWLCTWARSDGKVWLARSLDAGQTWMAPQTVILPGSTQVAGTQPGISSLGNNQWLLVWQGDAIYSSRTTDNGSSWDEPVRVQGSHSIGYCGHTSPCSDHAVFAPRVFSAPGDLTAFVGFQHTSTERPSGFTGPTYSYHVTDGHISLDGGASYVGNSNYSYTLGPDYRGSDEMAVDGDGNWMSARRGRTISSGGNWSVSFGHSFNNGNSFYYSSVAAVAGRENIWGKVALDHAGHWFRFWSGQQYAGFGELVRSVFVSASTDQGFTWTPETELDARTSYGADEPIDLDVKGSANGNFVAVWQANLPSGEAAIWYSTHNEINNVSAVIDWRLFE